MENVGKMRYSIKSKGGQVGVERGSELSFLGTSELLGAKSDLVWGMTEGSCPLRSLRLWMQCVMEERCTKYFLLSNRWQKLSVPCPSPTVKIVNFSIKWKVTGREQCSHVVRTLVERHLVEGRLHTQTRLDVVAARLVPDTDWVVVVDLGDLGKRLVDEDERDEHGEALLREASDVAHEKAQIERDHQQQDHRQPETDPESQRHEIHVV